MPTHEIRRAYKRPAISDQQKRRELSLLRQQQNRFDAQSHARRLASTLLSFNQPPSSSSSSSEPHCISEEHDEGDEGDEDVYEEDNDDDQLQNGTQLNQIKDVRQASKLRGQESRRWFARQLMLPEWMIDVPDCLTLDWFVLARPAGKRCFVVSINGTTVSRQRNGSVLHYFPSALPSGARTRENSGSAQSYCILDCIFHEMDQTYYVIDILCWRGYSLYDCNADFRFFWLNSKLSESGACKPPSHYHKYRFSPVPVYNCDQSGLLSAYTEKVPYVKDGLLFYNKHAHYQSGNTPLTLVWKDEKCSQYVIDTDSAGKVPSKQQVVLELQSDGKVTTSDDPPVVFGCLDQEFLLKSGLSPGNLLRFSISDGGLTFVDGKLEKADLQYQDKPNRARAFADSYSKAISI
ncbi:Snurportin-1 [Bienertia sinuspersici]